MFNASFNKGGLNESPFFYTFILTKNLNMKKVGILGSGAVAKVLATGFIKNGYEVMLGTRDPNKLADWQKQNPTGKVGSFWDATVFGDTIVLAVKGTVAKLALDLAGTANLKGKTIIDATNPIAETPPVNGVLNFFTTLNSSFMEDLQAAYPEAHFVKAFNSVGSAFMVNPDFGGIKPSMFICGNNDLAKAEVKDILTKFGWETEDMGKAEAARAIEPLCMLWCIPGFLNNQWTHAFKLLKK
ncbi:MAG: NAD(P)-binding domain-containing protein [Bacteroidia bacterium]|nr:NAD(P)-binding domain-containing protein [Bacteroidia bacterium]